MQHHPRHPNSKEKRFITALSTVVISAAARTRQAAERAHKIRVWIAGLAAIVFCVAVGAYGYSYYTLPRELRPFSDKHELLKPSGPIGINLGVLGTVLFCIIFLYALRKVIPWLGRLPGDIRIEGKHGSFYFPLVTCLLLSLLFSLVVWIVRLFRG